MNRIVDMTPDAKTFVLHSESDVAAPLYFVLDLHESPARLEAVAAAGPGLADRELAPMQPIAYAARDGTKWFEAGFRDWGGLPYDDVIDATRWALAQGHGDPARTCIVGGSFGGHMALLAATRNDGLFRCAVSIAGVSDLIELRRDHRQGARGADHQGHGPLLPRGLRAPHAVRRARPLPRRPAGRQGALRLEPQAASAVPMGSGRPMA